MDHCSMILVLAYLAESRSAKSGEVAEGLRLKRKHASVVLSRCFRRGLVLRQPYRIGRIRGFIYKLSDKGAEWMLYKAFGKPTDDQKSTTRVENKYVQSPKFETLNLNQIQQSCKCLDSIEPLFLWYKILNQNTEILSLKTEGQTARETVQTLLILLRSRTSERDFIYWLYQENLELLSKIQRGKTQVQWQMEDVEHESFVRGLTQGREIGFNYGIKLGIEIGRRRELIRTLAMLNNILLKSKSSDFDTSKN